MAEPIDFPITQSRLLYVYSINDRKHKGLLKVGEVFTDNATADNRNKQELGKVVRKILERRSYMQTVIYHLELVECTTYGNDCYTAQDIYDVLTNSGVESVALERYKTVAGVQDADIWFRTDLDKIKRAIEAKKEGHKTFNGTDNKVKPQTIRFRPEQEKAIAETVKHFNTKKGFECLWNAKMRFGKTLSALEVAKRMEYETILIVTHRPVVDKGWKDDFGKIFGSDKRYKYAERNLDDKSSSHKYNLDNFRTDTGLVASGKIRLVFFVSLQYLRLSTLVGGKDTSNLKKEIMQYEWDMVIVDEAHEGTESVMGSRVLDKLNKKGSTHVLSLSGTPFNLLDKFEEDKDKSKIYTWDYVMEQTAKNEWDDQHFGDPNPYAILPKMQIMTFTLSSLLKEQVQGKGKFSFEEFFRVWTGDPKIDHAKMPDGMKDRFMHESSVRAFLDKLCEKSATTAYPFSTKEFRRYFRHTFWMVPRVNSAAALEKMLKEHPVFGKTSKHPFEIVNVAGDGNIEDVGGKALQAVRNAIDTKDRTITLSCGKLTTGVTVPEWTAVLCMKGSEDTAAGGYMQTIFRVQSHAVINGRQKENCYVFDFAPDRALTAVAAASKYATIAAGEGNLKESRKKEEEHLTQFLKLCSVVSMDGATMGRQFTASRLFEKLNNVYIEKAVKSGYADNSLYDPAAIMNLSDEQKKALGDVHSLLGATQNLWKPDPINVAQSGMTDAENEEADKAEKKKRNHEPLSPEEKAALEERQKEGKERRARESVLRGVAIRIPLMVYGAEINDETDEITIDNFTELVDDASWVEYMPNKFTKEMFNILRSCFDRTVFTGAAKRIRSLVKEADELDIEDRIDKIASIFACFHNPDKETVLTPWRVVNMQLSDCLGGYCFFNEEFDGANYVTDPITKEEKKVPRFVSRPNDEDGHITQEVFGDYNTRILEINSKTGLYPLYCAYSVFKMIKEKAYIGTGLTTERKGVAVTQEQYDRYANDDKAIWEDVLQDNIFVICKTPMAVSITKRTLAGFMKDIHMNVKCYMKKLSVDALAKANIIKDKTQYQKEGITTKECDLIDVLRLNPDIFKNEVIKGRDFWHVYNAITLAPNEDINNMKFKAIVGNPPYQLETEGAGRQAIPLYNLFTNVSRTLKPHYISMIMPSRWFAGGMGLDEFRDSMRKDKHLAYIHDYTNAKDCFPQISISGGISYFLWNSEHNGSCTFTNTKNGIDSTSERYLDEFPIIVRYNEAISILRKVHQKLNKSIDTIISPLMPFGLSTNVRGRAVKSDVDYISLLASDSITYITPHEITKGKDLIPKWKVFMSKMSAEHAGEPDKNGMFSVFTKTTQVAPPYEVCTHSYFVIGSYDTQEEANNTLSYLKTRFVRFIVMTTLSAVNLSKLVFFNVPLQDFSPSSDIEWNRSIDDIDKQLYRKYEINNEEIQFIENMIKPME